jgi:hypothetical protein
MVRLGGVLGLASTVHPGSAIAFLKGNGLKILYRTTLIIRNSFTAVPEITCIC